MRVVDSNPQAVLVTGCSTGIGRASALDLHRKGFAVYATARKVEDLAELAEAGMTTLALDVTDEATMSSAVRRVEAEHGAVGVLVNNAGFELVGPVEETEIALARKQFDTNFFGLARLTQLALPGMRTRRHGRIVNVSSVFGRFAVAGGAFYDASKHAVTALSEALRRELTPYGIRVILIEPTASRTLLDANAPRSGGRPDSPYATLHERIEQWHTAAYGDPPANIAGRLAVSPEAVATTITRAATSRRPRATYPVGILAHGLFTLRRWLPRPAFDAFVRSQFPSP